MKQLDLGKRMLARPNLYSTPEQREAVKKRVLEKMKRRDRLVVKRCQIAFDFHSSEIKKIIKTGFERLKSGYHPEKLVMIASRHQIERMMKEGESVDFSNNTINGVPFFIRFDYPDWYVD